MLHFEELDATTRKHMLLEFRAEQQSADVPPFQPANLTEEGRAIYAAVLERAIMEGNEESLALDLANPAYWHAAEAFTTRSGRPSTRAIPANVRANRFGLTEFNTWYVRGLCARLAAEGIAACEVYRAAPAYEPREECRALEGHVLSVADVYAGHRSRYYPVARPDALSIPIGPNCHHSVRRKHLVN
ncbi:MAG: hypothetical protein WEE64_01205 [Dehalococcoidia bacterium]